MKKNKTVKRLSLLLAAVLLLLSLFLASCASIPTGIEGIDPLVLSNQDGLQFQMESFGQWSVVGYDGDGAVVNIPSWFMGMPVTSVGRRNLSVMDHINDPLSGSGFFASTSGTSVTEITIPDSVTYIGGGIFSGCIGLTSVTFENPNGWYVENIGRYALSDGGVDDGNGTNDLAVEDIAISATDVADPSIAATYLTSKYAGSYWTRD